MTDAWTHDPEQEQTREKAKAARREHQAKLEGVVAHLAGYPDGQYFLRWLVHGTGVFENSFPADHAQAAFAEGKRSVGLAIVALCAGVNAGAIIVNNEAAHE